MATTPTTDGDIAFAANLHVAQVRIARPTDKLEEVVAFYRDGLGLQELGRFAEHAGYDGVMLGLPGRHERAQLLKRLDAHGAPRVEPENPYWRDKSVTFEDPDGWRVVICAVTGV